MATTPRETTNPKGATPSSAPPKALKTAPPPREPKADPKPGDIIAERYRDTTYEALVGPNGENVTAAMTAGEAMMTGLAEVSQQVMDFAGTRLRDDLKSAEDFAKATTPEELFEKQCTFAKRAGDQYIAETSKLIGIMARIQQSCWAPMEERTKATLHGMNVADDDAKSEK